MSGIELKVDAEAITASIQKTIVKAVEQGAASWEISSAVTDAVKTAVLQANLPKLLSEQVQVILDREAATVVSEVAAEIVPALRAAMRSSVQAAMVSMVYGLLQGQPGYMGENERKRWDEARRSVLGENPEK